jgi:hypothetical protein
VNINEINLNYRRFVRVFQYLANVCFRMGMLQLLPPVTMAYSLYHRHFHSKFEIYSFHSGENLQFVCMWGDEIIVYSRAHGYQSFSGAYVPHLQGRYLQQS